MAARIEHKAGQIRGFEKNALNLAKENRLLKTRISNLEYEIQVVKAENNFLKIKEAKANKKSRGIASLSPALNVKNDLVKQKTFKWKPSQMLSIGLAEFKAGNYEKSAQFLANYEALNPNSQAIDDKFLYTLGVSAFNSGKHYDWAEKYLKTLIDKFPTSQYFRGAKLWRGLSFHKLGKDEEFFRVVDEFRLKYRNTNEWGILRDHYDEIRRKYKN
jgi:TolA-binding protein